MRKLVVIELLSLDGVMQSLGSPQEDTEVGSSAALKQREFARRRPP